MHRPTGNLHNKQPPIMPLVRRRSVPTQRAFDVPSTWHAFWFHMSSSLLRAAGGLLLFPVKWRKSFIKWRKIREIQTKYRKSRDSKRKEEQRKKLIAFPQTTVIPVSFEQILLQMLRSPVKYNQWDRKKEAMTLTQHNQIYYPILFLFPLLFSHQSFPCPSHAGVS